MNAPNLNRMREQLEAIKNPKSAKGNSDNRFWRLEVGSHQVRLLGLPDGNIMRDFHWHYGVNGKNYLCAKKSFGKDCPVCDLASNIWQEFVDGDREDESLKEMAKDLFASKRFYFPVLVRGMEDEGPKIYSCGTRAAEQILTIVLDEENEDLFDTEKGFDLKIKYALANPNDRRSASTTITAARKPSPLVKGFSEDEVNVLFGEIPDFDTLFELPNEDDIRQDLDSYIGGLDDSVSDSIGTSKFNTDESSTVMDAFKDLQKD